MLASITDGVITLDAKRAIVSVNEAAAATLGHRCHRVARPALERARADRSRELDVLLADVARARGAPSSRRSASDARRADARSAHRAARSRRASAKARRSPSPISPNSGASNGCITPTSSSARDARRVQPLRRAARRRGSSYNRRESVTLGGERARATIMFADIVGFSELAGAARRRSTSSTFSTRISPAPSATIFKHDGLLDKFYGDGLMCRIRPAARARQRRASRARGGARTASRRRHDRRLRQTARAHDRDRDRRRRRGPHRQPAPHGLHRDRRRGESRAPLAERRHARPHAARRRRPT